ncbi:hypothetical protein ACT691_01930 [Vibrio metschnikovii]
MRLRQQLRQLSCQLYHESLVEDNRRYYEVLYIAAPPSTDNNAPTISLVGGSLSASQDPRRISAGAKIFNHITWPLSAC